MGGTERTHLYISALFFVRFFVQYVRSMLYEGKMAKALVGYRKLGMLVALLAFGMVLVGGGCASDTTAAQKTEVPAVVRVSGTEGIVYSGIYGIIAGEEHPTNGTIGIGEESSKDYEVAVPAGSPIFGSFWKAQGSGGTLKAQILVNDALVAEGETSEDWGGVEIEWPQANEETTNGQRTGSE